MGVTPLDVARLGQGFAVFTSTLNHPTNSCNAVLAGETTLMVRQHVIETLGAPLYTLSMGSSGGAYTSLQIADAFPGLFDGVLTSATFPDALAISLQSSDGRLLNHYFRDLAPGSFSAAQQQAVGGYGAPIGLVANGNQAGRTDPVPGRKDADNYASAVWNPAVPASLRYDPVKTNPKGARPSVFDWAREHLRQGYAGPASSPCARSTTPACSMGCRRSMTGSSARLSSSTSTPGSAASIATPTTRRAAASATPAPSSAPTARA